MDKLFLFLGTCIFVKCVGLTPYLFLTPDYYLFN